MDGRPSTPSRPPDYMHSLPSYRSNDDDDRDYDTPTGHSSAAVRLLTSIDGEPGFDDSRSYVPLAPLQLSPTSSLHKASPEPRTTRTTPIIPPIVFPPPLAVDEANDDDQAGGTVPQERKTPDDAGDSSKQQQQQKEDSPFPPQAATSTTSSTTSPPRRKLFISLGSVKLQKRKKPAHVAFADLAEALPYIPEGPSERRKLRQSSSCPASPPEDSSNITEDNMSRRNNLHGPRHRTRSGRRTYQPSNISSHSGFDDVPSMPPPDSTYVPFANREGGSPRRPWTPSSIRSDYTRPPPSNLSYEPADLNGSPRPGTPSSQYGGSPRRPLPPAPLFSTGNRNSQAFADDATVSIPLHDHDDDDVFGPESDIGRSRPMPGDLPGDRTSYMSSDQETLSEMPDTYEKVEHYGPAPDGKQERRGVRAPQMSRKEVQLINGELVLECKIPTILYSFLPRRDEVEFTHMRYTAVTCDPDDFVDKGYKLRQSIGRTTRETELFICITMYNEDEIGFTRTMHAVMKNISHFCSRNKSRTWGEQGWQKIVVCIISDGRDKINARTLDALAAMGVYQDGIAKNYVNNRAVQAHVYEYTTQVSLDSDLKFKGAEKGIVPCQMIFCLKEKNQRKLNSHRWFFNAFGKALNPNVCILLDVGTRPTSNSLYHLWKAFDTDSNVAGACGEIKAMKGRLGSNLLNPLVASQNFEYKMSNILDKPLESVFGYITVLPGALSAYRYHALQNDETGHGPLSQYFKGETLHGKHADVFTANMYLAEDRILCWELVTKRSERWVLKYVKSCKGETDVPGKLLPSYYCVYTKH